MQYLIIHIGDIHIKNNNNSILDKEKCLFDAIKNHCIDKKNIFIVITGDIAYSGRKDEFEISLIFLKELAGKISKYSSIEPKFILIPGNHDCDHTSGKPKIRKTILENIRATDGQDVIDDEIDILTETQNNYFFFENLLTESNTLLYADKLLKIHTFNQDGENINFICYNTAWDSELSERPGKMVFPISRYRDIIKNIQNQINISLLHHPFNWQEPTNSRSFRNTIEETSEIILSGHEHQISVRRTAQPLIKKSDYLSIECPALQDNDNAKSSGFNLIEANSDSSSLTVSSYVWKKDRYEINDLPVSLPLELKDHKYKFKISELFNDFLINPGAEFSHPQKDHIELDDIYIEPYLLKLFQARAKKQYEIFNHKLLASKSKMVFLGEESSGKTTLCKKTFLYFYKIGKFPVYIKGDEITQLKTEGIIKIVKSKFLEQYEKSDENDFDQTNKEDIVIIIDDFHNIKYENNIKIAILTRIVSVYEYVIYTGNDLIKLESLINKKKSAL
jgi:UDP-2,3-diacylglucosamine pyrophosphatase LpxH